MPVGSCWFDCASRRKPERMRRRAKAKAYKGSKAAKRASRRH